MDNRTATPEPATGRWLLVSRRMGAYVIDLVLAFAFYALVQTLLFPLVLDRFGAAVVENGWFLELYVVSTISLPIWLYFILSERSRWQATVGKRLLGLRVRAEPAGAASTGQIILRTAGKLLPWELAHFAVNVPSNPWIDPEATFAAWRIVLVGVAYLLLILYIVAVIRRPQQTVYDRLAGTVVVDTGR